MSPSASAPYFASVSPPKIINRSLSYKSEMDRLYDRAKWAITEEAMSKGADAILGFRIDFDEISGKGKSMFMISVSGTAVKLKDYQEDSNLSRYEIYQRLYNLHKFKECGIITEEQYNTEKDNITYAYEENIKSELEQITNKAPWMEIKGLCDLEMVIKEMLGCGIFVLPTYTEGFPNVIIESMACGCAIVTTAVGAIPEILAEDDGKPYGIIIEPQNVDQLTVAIQKMLTDTIFMQECKVNVQKRVKDRYNIDSIWQQITTIWDSCTKL